MKKTSFSPLNDFRLSFIDVSIYNLVLVQDFNLIKVPRHREDLEKFSVQCRLQFQANNAQLITAIASSGPILETPQRSDLLTCLCKRSFFSVPHPGGMSERHSFCMCLRRHSNWWRVSLGKRSFQENNNRSRFASISSEPGVLVVLSVPRSPFRRKMRDNSEENCLP